MPRLLAAGCAAAVSLVQDNLNTHTAGSFYEALPPEEAFELARRLEFHFTPKKGSWLNMAEIELSALSKQCLDRRIADLKTLKYEVSAWESESAPRRKQTGHPRRRRMKAEPCNPDRNLT